MRFFKLALAALVATALAACGDAGARDMTLTYRSSASETDSLVVQADGEGRMRLDDGRGQTIITRDNQTYLVFPGEGQRDVARLDDFLAVGAEVREQMRQAGALSEQDARYAMREEGPQAVGQWQGVRYSISPVDASGVSQDVVISTDPALEEAKPVALAAFQTLTRISNAVMTDPPEFTRLSGELMARGMPISVDGRELQGVSTEAVPAERFELPGPVLTRDQLRQRRQNQR